MAAQHIVLGITSNSFWFIGVYLVVLGLLMVGMYYGLMNKKSRSMFLMIDTVLSIVVYLVGGVIVGLILGVHFYYEDSERLGLLLSGVPGIMGLLCSLLSFTFLVINCRRLLDGDNQDIESTIESSFSNNYVFGFSQLTLLMGLIFTVLPSGAIIDLLLKIPNDNEVHWIGLLAVIPYILGVYLQFNVPKWFEKSAWTYAIQQQLVQDYPTRLKRRRDRNK